MKYEYKIIRNCEEYESNKLGLEGWRLVTVHNWTCYFERPLKEEVPEEVLRKVLE